MDLTAFQSAEVVRSAFARIIAFSLGKAFSMGLKSGL